MFERGVDCPMKVSNEQKYLRQEPPAPNPLEGPGHAHLRSTHPSQPYGTRQRPELGSHDPRGLGAARGRNGLKHGMAGQGIVIPEADLAEVESRNAAHEGQAPKSVMGVILGRPDGHALGQVGLAGPKKEPPASRSDFATPPTIFDAERVLRAEELTRKSIGSEIMRDPASAPQVAAGDRADARGLAGPAGRPDARGEAVLDQFEGRRPGRGHQLGLRIEQVKETQLDALSRAVRCDPFGADRPGEGQPGQGRHRGLERSPGSGRAGQRRRSLSSLEAHYRDPGHP